MSVVSKYWFCVISAVVCFSFFIFIFVFQTTFADYNVRFYSTDSSSFAKIYIQKEFGAKLFGD